MVLHADVSKRHADMPEQAAHEPMTTTGGAVPMDLTTAVPLLTQQGMPDVAGSTQAGDGLGGEGGDVGAVPVDVGGGHGPSRHGGPAWQQLSEERLRAQAGEL